MEGSRIVSGCMAMLGAKADLDGVASHEKNLIYTVEVVCATERHEKAVRFTLYHQGEECPLLGVVFADRSVFESERDLVPSDTVAFAIKSGFTDSLPAVRKMSCLNYDYGRHELETEVREKLAMTKSVDIHKDYLEILKADQKKAPPAKTDGDNDQLFSGGSRLQQRPHGELGHAEDKTFITLAKLKESMINKSLKNNVMLFRKVMLLDGRKRSAIITVLREDNPFYVAPQTPAEKAMRKTFGPMKQGFDEYLIKLVVSEQKRLESHKPGNKFNFHASVDKMGRSNL